MCLCYPFSGELFQSYSPYNPLLADRDTGITTSHKFTLFLLWNNSPVCSMILLMYLLTHIDYLYFHNIKPKPQSEETQQWVKYCFTRFRSIQFFCCYCCCFETGSPGCTGYHFLDEASLELTQFCLLLPPKCWDWWHVLL